MAYLFAPQGRSNDVMNVSVNDQYDQSGDPEPGGEYKACGEPGWSFRGPSRCSKHLKKDTQ